MPLFNRPDGTYLKKLHPFRVMIPYLMRTRTESILFYPAQLDLTKTLPYLKKINKKRSDDDQVTLFHIIMNAAVRALAMKPQLNRYVSGNRFYQRNRLSFNFVVKKELNEKGEEVNKKVNFEYDETIDSIVPKCKSEIKDARSDSQSQDEKEMNLVVKLPRFMIMFIMWVFRKLDYYNMAPKSMIVADPLMCSCFVASLGSLGLDSLYHHMFEWGTNSVFLLIGKIKKVPVVDDKDRVVVREVVEVTFSLDDRVSEAVYFKNALDLFQKFVENPELLEKKPEIAPEVLEELNLKPNKVAVPN